MSAFAKSFVIAAAVTIASVTDVGVAQSTPPRSIYMVLQTESTLTQTELRDRFEQARTGCPECSVESYDINPINESTYVLLKSVLQGDGVPRTPVDQGPVRLKPFEGRDGEWEVNLDSHTKYLESATLKVASPDGPDEEVTMTAKPKGEVGAELRYYSPGVYILKVPTGKKVKSATFALTEYEAKGQQTAPKLEEVPWPDDGRCYLVTLKGVQGDEKALYATLKDDNKVSNPLKGLEDATNAALVLGSFTEVLGVPLKFLEDAIQLTFPKPGGVQPKRMWMRFPLTEAELTALQKELDIKFSGEGFKNVPAWIRQNLLGETLTPEGSTGWFEIPWSEKVQAFDRTLPIETLAWQQRLIDNRDFMGANAVLIYEFEGPDGAQRINKLDNGKYYRPETMWAWLTGLPTARTAKE